MEENKEQKLTYEQLEQIAIQMNNRAMQAEAKLNSINTVAIRLDYLHKVLDKYLIFPGEFVDKCVNEIMDLMKPMPDTDGKD